MKKLFILLTMLIVGIGSMWADGLKVSTTESSSAEYQYKIFCRAASSYYLGNTTNATNSGTDYGLFAFFKDDSGDYENGYYIYSIFAGKWVTYTAGESYGDGQNKISLVSEKPSVPWNIAADDSDNKYYDISPFKTDKTVATMSWNWHGGAAANTSNTMGFYSYTGDNSGWGIVLAGGSGSPVADRKVVAFYNRDTKNDEYPITPNSGVVVAGSTTAAAQLFVLKQNGIDSNGEAQYNLAKAEGDGKYLRTPGAPTSSEYGTSPTNYLLINQSCSFISNYTKTNSDFASSPYYNLVASNGSYRSLHSNNNGANMNGWTTTSPEVYVTYGAKGAWNNLWTVKEQAYTAWQVVISGATNGTITYSGSALISGGTATQSNNGMFVLSATPTVSDLEPLTLEGYCIDPTVSIDNDRKIIKVVYTRYDNVPAYASGQFVLDNAPEGLGYPTGNARARLQMAINNFAESKTLDNFTELTSAYTSFSTNIVLPEGKVYTIQSYIKSPSTTTYLKNEDGTLTIGEAASATTLNNLWVVRKSGNNYVLQSASDPTKYIVYNSFTLAAAGSTWTLSCGTEWPCISMYNSSLGGGRYVACNGSNQFGTANDNYYANNKTQSSGWSTDFKFVESEDYALYKVKIIYPSGSAPTVTYNETAYSNGADFVAPTTLGSTDLIASSITGYTANISINNDIIYVNYTTAFDYADTWNFDNSPWSLLNDTPAEIDKPSRTYRFNTKKINVNTTFNCSIVVKFAYTTGSFRIDVAGVDLLDPSTGDVVYYDYHDGYSGTQQSNREYTIDNVAPGNYILRYISYAQSTSSAGNISVKITPVPGFYRIKGKTSNTYLAAGSASNGKYNMTNKTDATTIFYFDGQILTNLSSGMCNGVTTSSWAWVVGTDASTVTFKPGLNDRGLAINTSDALLYDNGDNSASADSGPNVDITTSTNDRYCSWELTEITTLPITLKASALGYATFNSPVPVKLPTDVVAYVCLINDSKITLYKANQITVDGRWILPANTPVLLYKSGVTKDTPVDLDLTTYSGESYDNNGFTPTVESRYQESGKTYYALRKKSGVMGFYQRADQTAALPGFRAWIRDDSGSSSARQFTIIFDGVDNPTGIVEALGLENENVDIYDLNGRKLQTYKNGINIVNGKKVFK